MDNLNKLKEDNYFIAVLDGAKCHDIKSFLAEIGNAFKFPDYYGNNMNALDECINDLSWIDNNNFALFIRDYSLFLSEEDVKDKESIMNFLEKVSKEWREVPNYPGEEEFRHKADFKVVLG